MRRRYFIGLLGGAAVSLPLTARAQRKDKVPTIGFLGVNAAVWSPWTGAFVERLRALGWIDGRTVTIEYRWSEGRSDRYSDIAAEFVRQKVDIIVTSAAAVPAVKAATSVIPIVFAIASDPVGTGLVASLARPGGNVTGLSVQANELGSKRLQLLRDIIPGFRRLAIMVDIGKPDDVLEMNNVHSAARALGIEVTTLEIRRPEDIAPALDTNKVPADALYVVISELLNASRSRIITLASNAKLPTIFGTRDWVQDGGLMSYGPSFPDLFRRTAELVDVILRGGKPGDIPVEQPTKFELVFNLNTAKALGLTVPASLLSLADQVIE